MKDTIEQLIDLRDEQFHFDSIGNYSHKVEEQFKEKKMNKEITERQRNKRQRNIDDCRELLDFLEANPGVPGMPNMAYTYFWSGGKDEFLKAAKALGTFEKEKDGDNLVLRRRFGSAKIEFHIPQSAVCRKVTVMKEVEEYECDPLLSADEMAELEAAA